MRAIKLDLHIFAGLEGLCILLRRLAYPNRLFDLVRIFHRDISSLSRIIYWTLNFVYERFNHKLTTLKQKWITKQNLYHYAEVSTAQMKILSTARFVKLEA